MRRTVLTRPFVATALLAAALTATPPEGLAQSPDTLRARIERALQQGDADAARRDARTLVGQQRRRAGAHVLLARARLAGPEPDRRGAYRAVYDALALDRQSADALALRLWLERQGVGVERLPVALQRQQRADTRARLLGLDSARTPLPARALALLDGGEDAFETFLFLDHRVGGVGRARTPNAPPSAGAFDLQRFRTGATGGDYGREAREAAEDARDRLERGLRLARLASPDAPPLDVTGLVAPATVTLARLYAATGETNALLRLAFAERRRRPADPSPWRWQGAALAASGQVEAAAAAFDSARVRATPALRAALDDLARLARPADVDRFTAGDDGPAAFWDAADPRRLTPVNERRVEHDARVALADLLFEEPGPDGAPRPGRDAERGRLFVRYGAPTRRATFATDTDGAAFRHLDVWQYEVERFVFGALLPEGPYSFYSPGALAHRLDPERARVDDYATRHAEIVQRSPSESTYAPRTQVPLGLQAAAFRADDGRVDLVVGLALPLSAAEREAWAGGAVGVALLREGETVEAEHRRTLAARPDASLLARGGGALWLHAETLRVRPGRYRLRAEAQIEGGPVGLVALDLSAPVYESRFAVSDVLLAHRVTADTADRAPGDVLRDGRAIQPAGDAAFERSAPFYTVFEVYGLRADAGGATAFDVEATLTPEARGGAAVTTNFTVTGRSARAVYAGRLDASALPPGRVRLLLRIRDRTSGQTVETTRALTLL